MTSDPRIEACARAMCIAQGDDPDAEGRGLGHSMPLGSVYKLWEQRIPAARAVVEEWLKQEASPEMLAAAAGRPRTDKDAHASMCAQAAREIGGG